MGNSTGGRERKMYGWLTVRDSKLRINNLNLALVTQQQSEVLVWFNAQ
ncbi:hypothetical protein NDA07_08500 [Microcoleus vaginatus DQ-U2]|nr:hypothetical protein [Microcoleus sp. FACHB-DQ6]